MKLEKSSFIPSCQNPSPLPDGRGSHAAEPRASASGLVCVAILCALALSAQKLPSYKDLKYPPLKQVKIPDPVEVTLTNGMRVFLLEDHELPVIQGVALVRTGNLFDPPDKRGLADLTAAVLRSGGTKAKTGDQLDEELENMAASVESGMDESSASLSFSGLKENTQQILQLFKEIVTAPEFRQDKLDLALTQERSGIARRNDEASAIPQRELLSLLYGRDTPYGWQVEYEHLNRIHREDLQNFYKRYYFPKNIMLAVYGDFSATQMKDLLEKTFADWKVDQPPVPKFPEVTAKPAPGIYFVERPDVTQTFFAIGHLGGDLRDPDFAALGVAANILGEGFSSRLMSQIRTKLGYAYNIGASWAVEFDHPGTFRIQGSTKSATTVETIQAIGVELDKLRSQEVSERELAEAKDAVLNGFVFNFDSPAKTLRRVLRYTYYGYPKSFLFDYQKAVANVTRADVLRVAKQRFRAENLAIVAVGNSKEFGKPLAALGKVTALDVSIPEDKVDASAAPPAKQASAQSIAQGKQLLARVQQAMGGSDKLASIKDSVQLLEMAMDPSAGGFKMKQTVQFVAPNHYRQDQELPFGKIIAYTDGATGWLSSPQGVLPMPPEVLKQAQGELFRRLSGLVLSDRDASRTVSAVDDHTIEISASDGQSIRIEIDASTGLPTKESYQSPGIGGAPTEVAQTFSDWRETGGFKMPFKSQMEQGGKKIADVTVSEYKFNTGLTQAEIGKRP
jgi:zinc protease